MVVFNCNACGESLKKNQVDKHYQTVCRRCEVLSCVDCGKDFWGDGYKEHTKCISEEEKYSGKNYKPRANANKGEAKQEAWLEKVQNAIDKANPEPRVKDLLETLKEYPNIPRKKAKFENFLSNSLRVRDRFLSSKVWDLLMETIDEKASPAAPQGNSIGARVPGQNSEATDNGSDLSRGTCRGQGQGQGNNSDKGPSRDAGTDKKCKKQNKRKHKDKGTCESENGDDICDEDQSSGRRKAGKRKSEEPCDEVESSATQDTEDQSPVCKKQKTKVHFDWGGVIHQILLSKTDQEISIKKLKKKVIAEYLSQGGVMKSEEKLWAKFHKKVNKNPSFTVLKDRVRLVQ